MIEPLKSDDGLLADIRTIDAGSGCALWWLGQSGFLVKSAIGHLLFDPYLSESLTKKYAATDKPHVRMTRRPIDPARLDMIDVVNEPINAPAGYREALGGAGATGYDWVITAFTMARKHSPSQSSSSTNTTR